jgi:hypothetical protein
MVAQSRLQLELAAFRAPIWNHTPRLTIQTGVPRWGREIGLRWQTLGARDWQAWQRYPTWGVTLQHVDLGDQSHGSALAVLPNIEISLLRRPNWSVRCRVGTTGLAWIQKPYDPFSNPGQNALSTRLNIVTQIRLGAQLRLSPHLQMAAGVAFTHFSNGGFSLPNFGINLPGPYLAVQGSANPLLPEDFKPALTSARIRDKRWGGQVVGGATLVEYSSYDGPRYAVWTGAAATTFAISRVNRLLLGIDYEYNNAVYTWGLHSTLFRDKPEARLGATRLGLFLADELRFGHLGIQVHAGLYLGRQRLNRQTLTPVYNKLTVYYYLPPAFGKRVRPFAGICLKAHKNIAEYIAVNLGWGFGKGGD